jgi:hypothetical protein
LGLEKMIALEKSGQLHDCVGAIFLIALVAPPQNQAVG